MSELRHDQLRRFLDAPAERVIALHVSSNAPHVQAGGRSAQPASAVVAALMGDDGRCEVAVALHLPASGDNVIYAGQRLAPDQVPDALEQAVVFAESMGFLLDDSGVARMSPAQRERAVQRTPQFHPPRAPVIEAPGDRPKPKDGMAAM